MKNLVSIAGASLALVLGACTSSGDGAQQAAGASGSAGSASSAGSAGKSSSAGNPGSGGKSSASGGARNESGSALVDENAGMGGSSDPKTYPPGLPGCGLDAAAFCETFDAPAGKVTRAGELDPARFSAARMCEIGGPTSDGRAVGILPARVPACRDGLPAQVFPSADALICDGNDDIQSNHLLVLVAAQNYGQNSYRIRQPFDFAERTGKLVFDAEGYNIGLLGWISLEITEDPTPAPSFTTQQNYENGAIPKNAVEVQFGHNCGGDHVGVSDLFVYDDYVQNQAYNFEGGSEACAAAAQGRLNRFTVELSQDHIQVWATDASSDGVTFGTPVSILSHDVSLPFTRGYVHLTTHNHATLKYSEDKVDAWLTRWDNVGFDGPALTGATREYEVQDSLFETPGKVNIGYRLADADMGPAQQIEIPDVELAGASSARIALGSWTLHFPGDLYPDDFALHYRLNGHAWRDQKLTPAEIAMAAALPNAGTRSTMLDVNLSDLVEGNNVLELTTSGAPMSYPPAAFNIDLILATE